jgi:hypothetical protein
LFLARVRVILGTMKTFISLLIVYIAVCIGGSLVGASFYMIYQSLKLFVVGQPLTFFSLYLFYQGIFFVFPLVCAASSLFMILYLIRHPAGVVLPLLVYLLTGCLSWYFLIPLSLSQSSGFKNTGSAKTITPVLSPGFFREDTGGVYYYTRIAPNGTADGLYIDLRGFSGEQGKILKLDSVPVNTAAAGPFSDLLIRDAVALPRIIRVPLSFYQKQLYAARAAGLQGKIAWLCFASAGLALLSVFALQLMSEWRLLNAFLVIAVFFSVGLLNGSYYGGTFLASAALRFGIWWRTVSAQLPAWLIWLKLLRDPFIVFLNGIISLLFILLGIGTMLLKKMHPDTHGQGSEI